MSRKWFRTEWYEQQDSDKKWIEEQEKMSTYIKVFEGFLNDNAEGVQKNSKAPKYRSSGSGKSAIVATQDIPAGSVIAFAAWGGKGNYGNYIKLSGQLIAGDPVQSQPQQNASTEQPAQEKPDFDDDIPF